MYLYIWVDSVGCFVRLVVKFVGWMHVAGCED